MLPKLIVLIAVLMLIAVLSAKQSVDHKIRYVALGDSYTAGGGAKAGTEDFPTLLTHDLRYNGLDIILVANLARTGRTSQDVIDLELPVYSVLRPNFATLLIGANDWIREVPIDTFRQNFAYILDKAIEPLPDSKHLIILTIPAYDQTPVGIGLGLKRTDGISIHQFNDMIKEEAGKRGVGVVDLSGFNLDVRNDPSLLSSDGLHPSAKQYALWEKLIYPTAYQVLK